MRANTSEASDVRDLERFAGPERRRSRPVDQSPVEVLQQMPALVVLERLPEPTLAVDHDDTMLFANGAFCDMLGHAPNELLAMKFSDIFCGPDTPHSEVVPLRAHRDRLVQLAHKDGHPVWAGVSKSVVRSGDGTLTLFSFHDCTEELWLNG